MKILVKKAEGENFPCPGKPLHTEIVVIGVTELEIWVSDKIAVGGEILGDDRAHLLERGTGEGLGPSHSYVHTLGQFKGSRYSREKIELLDF